MRYLIFLLTFLSSLSLVAQRQQKFSVEYTNASFEQVVKDLESKTSYYFQYQHSLTDSLQITVSVHDQPLSKILDEVFTGTLLRYYILDKNVFITNGREILTELPGDFFNQGDADKGTTFNFSDYDQEDRERKEKEEKTYFIGKKTGSLTGNAVLSGQIRDKLSGEPMIGAAVFVENPMIGVAADQFGNYSLTLPKGKHKVFVKSIGMKTTHRYIMLNSDGKLNIDLEEDITPLKEVIIESERDVLVSGMQMGVEKLDIKTMKQMPSVLGETDVMKVVLTLPGVQSVGEGTAGINVRGGATSQNLILYNDATLYNPSHLFGFFSTFNPDVLKNVELYKSGITADYGGRLSAVLDVNSREGNLKKFTASGGISPVTGRLTLEGPILKEKASFLLAARSTYSDWILRQIDSKEIQNSEAAFYDLNASIGYKVNDKNSLTFSAYRSRDRFKLNNDTIYSYQDQNASLKWKHVFSKRLFGTFVGSYSQYNYAVTSDDNPVEAFKMDFAIKQLNAKGDLSYALNNKQTLTAGINIIHYGLSPGTLKPEGDASEITPVNLQDEQALESAVYVGDNFEINPKLSIYAGVRYSFYTYLGPRDIYQYEAGITKSQATITDTTQYGSGEPIVNYNGLEPRVSLRYILSNSSSFKFSYNRMRQYIQMISNTTALAPTDIWKLSDPYIKPQIGDQFSIGYYKNLKSGMFETSIEAYYKTISNSIDYKNGATLILNPTLETDVLNAEGKAYGAEFLLKKVAGKLNGWVSYTYSRSLLRTTGSSQAETVNDGEYYASSYDKPHSFNFIGNYKISRRFNFSLNVTYSTGRPITIPIGKYELGGASRLVYGPRNGERIPDYFRTDFSLNIEGNHKIKKLAHSSWTLAVYNLTGRANAYSVFFQTEGEEIKGYKLSIFAQPIPTITYNFRF